MQLNRDLILDTSLAILESYGLADLTMRRIAKTLDVAPGALYWHFPNKQALLGAVAGRICATLPTPQRLLGHGSDDATVEEISHTTARQLSADLQASEPVALSANVTGSASAQATQVYCQELYSDLTSTRDGAEIVLAAIASGTMDRNPRAELEQLAGPTGGEILLHYVFGAALDFQAQQTQQLAIDVTTSTASLGSLKAATSHTTSAVSLGSLKAAEEATHRVHHGVQLMVDFLSL